MATPIRKHVWLNAVVFGLCISLTLLVTALPVRAQSVATLTTTCLNKFYAIPLEAKSWKDARDAALALGGHLAIIDSPAENECLANWVASQSSAIKSVSSALSSGGGVHYVWLGATDDFSEGTWNWVDGRQLYANGASTKYTKWGSGPLGTEPDNSGNQDYLAMALDAWPSGPASGQGIGRAGEWNDITGTALNTYMVEFETSASKKIYGGPLFSSAQKSAWSFIRYFNTGATAGTITVTLKNNATGALLASWQSPSIAAGAEQQYAIKDIEKEVGIANPPSYYSFSVESSAAGYFQHVLYRPADGTLTNLSTCVAGVASDTTKIAGVHSSLVGDLGFPSSIAVNNTGAATATVTLGIYDARNGSKLGSYTTSSIPSGGLVIVTVATMEMVARITRDSAIGHYVVSAEGSFAGFLQHLVYNQKVGVITDMTTACENIVTATAATNTNVVRVFYHIPSDRKFNQKYADAIQTSIKTIQTYFLKEVGVGKSFTLLNDGKPEVINSQKDSAFLKGDIGGPHGQGNWWYKVQDDLSAIMGGPPRNQIWFVMSDSEHSCEGMGGAANTLKGDGGAITIMPSDDIHGLVGEPAPCADVFGKQPLARWHMGQAHEVGHTFGLQHPIPSEPSNIAYCKASHRCLMEDGWQNPSEPVLTQLEKDLLKHSKYFEDDPLATYQLKNKQTGQCADLYYGDSSPGTSLISYYCGTDLNMKWEFENVGGNAYRLINVKSRSCMTVASETSVSTKTVQIGWCEPSNFSYWEAISDKSGGVEFKNKSKGTCLAITNATPLTDLKLSACGQDSSTVWSMVGVVQ